jgi:CspA family cold shock protein
MASPTTARFKGTVKTFFKDKGYGFITPSSGCADVFFHKSSVELSGFRGHALTDGVACDYSVQEGEPQPDQDAGDSSLRAVKVTGPLHTANALRKEAREVLEKQGETSWIERLVENGSGGSGSGGQDDGFVSGTGGRVEERLAEETVGLVSAEEFKIKRARIEQEEADKEGVQVASKAKEIQKAEKKKKKAKTKQQQAAKSALSFELEDDE